MADAGAERGVAGAVRASAETSTPAVALSELQPPAPETSGCNSASPWRIARGPADARVSVGEAVTFSVHAEGSSGSFDYQWLRDGEPIEGARSHQYSFVATPNDGGAVFTVKVRPRGAAACQEVESSSASLGWRDFP